MQIPANIKDFAKWMAARFPTHRPLILRTGARVAGWLGSIAVLSAAVSFAINGTEFFTEKIPRAVAVVAKTALLGATLRPVLIRHVIEKDLGYSGMCVGQSGTLDLDNDGDASDLILSLKPKSEGGICDAQMSLGEIYVILKLGAWDGVWPTYQSVATLARSPEGTWGQSTDLPMTFESHGQFLLARAGGSDSPEYEVFGYANGVLNSFGRFKPIGSSFEVEDENSEPVMQIGNQMFLNTEKSIMNFQVTDHGQFLMRPLSSLDIVIRNNAALVLELFDAMPASTVCTDCKSQKQTYQTIKRAPESQCDLLLFANGAGVTLEPRRDGDMDICVGTLKVARTTVVTPRMPCDIEGLRRTSQFPWGYIYDPASSKHIMRCPLDGEHESFKFQIEVKLDESRVAS